ncbi:hypothetical protein SHI21_02675 [Bacteriovorax sp. PP10]|uniref:Lipoprotein n=1 Tax=Bacteriovorax antarcticus TaxID=3088717 RepID=A0ABU5VPX4_9BACT|nr:hypothetical protein [Bacteriovorax sp. PP10]MEA9355084.1 hypothetical protein [Bacteriovorax sp. PP10]
MKIIFLFIFSLTLVSCVKKKMVQRTTNEYTKEELVVIEFATRMEEQEHKYEDYHKTEK